MECHFVGIDEVFAVCIVAQLTIFRQTKRMQIALNVQYDGKVSTASNFDDRRSSIVDPSRFLNDRSGGSDSTLTAFVITASVHGASV